MGGEEPDGQVGPVYEKGERRHKHVGKNDYPEFEYINDNPRYAIGKCPKNLVGDDRTTLLREAIPDGNGDREVAFHKRLYAVHRGAIYRAETTTYGKSYHGYPYRGKIGRALLEKLRSVAVIKECLKEFDDWVDQHIELHGK